jgi:hypothetical protein
MTILNVCYICWNRTKPVCPELSTGGRTGQLGLKFEADDDDDDPPGMSGPLLAQDLSLFVGSHIF